MDFARTRSCSVSCAELASVIIVKCAGFASEHVLRSPEVATCSRQETQEMQSVARNMPAVSAKRGFAALLILALSLVSAPCTAEVYPLRPVKIVVGYAPGGGNDIVARFLAKKFQEMTGQAFVVENKTGADSTIASNYVAKSSADGYTLLMTGMGGFTIAPALYAGQLQYDPIKDFVAVGTVARFAYVLATNSSVPART